MKKILITGAGGFVGQHLARNLVEKYKTIGIAYTKAKFEPIKKATYVRGDILKNGFLADVVSKYKPDAIIHLAAQSIAWLKNSKEAFGVNLFGTMNLYEGVLEVQKKDKKYNPKILYVSSSQIYGKSANPRNIKEDSSLNPPNYYSASKTAADRASYAYSQSAGLKIAILRPFPHTGPGQRKGFFIPDMASQIAKIEKNPKKKKLMVGNLNATRDYLDARDVVEAYKLMIEADWVKGEVYNICSSKGIKMKKLLDMLLDCSNAKIEIKKDPERLRQDDIPVSVGNNEKIKRLTGWRPKIDIKQTLEETLEYWRKLR